MSTEVEEVTKLSERERILALNDRELVAVSVPEWGMHIFVRPMNGDERGEFDALVAGQTPGFVMAALVAFTACDEDGRRIFTADDIEALRLKNAVPLAKIGVPALRINAITDVAIEQLKSN